ncbi:MAG: hypothetical protein AAF772_04880 [Acidobacteriota bacterium]
MVDQSIDRGAKVEDGTVYALFPEVSREFYEECLRKPGEERRIKVSSTLDMDQAGLTGAIREGIQKAEAIVADLTGGYSEVMCQLSLARGLKDVSKLVVICSADEPESNVSDYSVLFDVGKIHRYDPNSLPKLSSHLTSELTKALKRRPPDQIISDMNARKMVKAAIDYARKGEHFAARTFFEKADEKVPDHWYILMNWAISLREDGEAEEARSKLRRAEMEAEFDEHRADVFIELALVESQDKEISKAEDFFEKAKKADKKKRRIYIAWASVLDHHKFTEKAVARIGELIEMVGSDEESNLLLSYYVTKLGTPGFDLSFEKFRRKQARVEQVSVRADPKPIPKNTVGQTDSDIHHIPHRISWVDFSRRYVGKNVYGQVKNVHSQHGVFIYIASFVGLLHRQQLGSDFQRRFRAGQEVAVQVYACRVKGDKKEINLNPAV